MKRFVMALSTLAIPLFANPYPDPRAVPKDPPYFAKRGEIQKLDPETLRRNAVETIRVDVSWTAGEKYEVTRVALEKSGTEALVARSVNFPKLGSYIGTLSSHTTGRALVYDSVGTGMEMRL